MSKTLMVITVVILGYVLGGFVGAIFNLVGVGIILICEELLNHEQ